MFKSMSRWSLRARLYLLFLILALIFISLIAFIWYVSIEPELIQSATSRYATPEQIYKSVSNVFNSALLLLSVGSLVALLIIHVVTKDITKPIRELTATSEALGRGDFERRVHIQSDDEFGKLGNTFNTMAALIQTEIANMQREDELKDEFISLASHNLRTPVTAVKGYVELMKRSKSLSQTDRELLEKLGINAKVLDRLVEEILGVTTMGSEGLKLNYSEVKLSELISEAMHEVSFQSKLKGVNIKDLTTKDYCIKVDRNHIQDVIVNLLDNAVKFSSSGQTVEIKTETRDKKVLVTIKDKGIGIKDQEFVNLFQKFHRATDYLTYDYPGIGLGLYFSKVIIESHGENIWLESKENQGTTLSFTLPITEELK